MNDSRHYKCFVEHFLIRNIQQTATATSRVTTHHNSTYGIYIYLQSSDFSLDLLSASSGATQKVISDKYNYMIILCEKVLVAEVSTMEEIAKYNDRYEKMLSLQYIIVCIIYLGRLFSFT